MTPREYVLLAILSIACIGDVRSRRIPNSLIACGLVAGLAWHTWSDGTTGLQASLLGFCVGIALFLPFFALHWMGAGDVKLLGLVGTFAGVAGVFTVAVYSAIAGGILGTAALCIRERQLPTLQFVVAQVLTVRKRGDSDSARDSPPESSRNPDSVTQPNGKIPYAIAIFAGTLTWMLTTSR